MVELVLSPMLAFVLCVAFILLLRKPAYTWNLIDQPGGRKIHEDSIPLIGGVAMFASLAITYVLTSTLNSTFGTLLVCLGILVFSGVLDDRYGLGAKRRIAIQLIVSALMIAYGGVGLVYMGNLLTGGELVLGPVSSWFFTMF
ncbi:MAG: hypothetical protein KGL58_04675, partial [Pseudomonadota bacterium]|nr:hypothetical protein [Pseudomonadota bacterium]